MSTEPVITIRIGRRALLAGAAVIAIAISFIAWPEVFQAQKSQENFKEKLDISESRGSVAIAVSADGKHVYVAGPEGVIVSDDFGKTGSWTQTVRLK